jgi:triacylglycerol lipase
MIVLMKMQIFSPFIVGLLCGALFFFSLSLPFWGCFVLGLALLKIVNRFPSKLIHWIHALVFEAFALILMWCCRPLGYIWKLQSRKGNGQPILLVHGYFHDSSAWIYHRWRLLSKGFGPIYMINLKHPFLSLTQYVKKVEMKVAQIEKETGRKDLILIGHSMGGIVSSLYATTSATPGTVTDIITIGSPLQGTYMAKIALGKCGREMQIGSTLLKELGEKIRQNKTIRFYHVASKTDEIVIPYTSALADSQLSELYILNDIGHATLLYSPRVSEKIISWLFRSYGLQ